MIRALLRARTFRVHFIGLAAAVALCTSCDKVPLREHVAQFEVASAHWYENERAQYVFFSVKGLRPGQASTEGTGLGRFEMAIDGGDFKPVDYAKGLHEHRLVKCGSDALCGSFSFRTEEAPRRFRIRYAYSAESTFGSVAAVSNEIHRADAGAYAQSAFVYGAFDAENRRVQARVHDNFGTPDSAHVAEFGLVRRFAVEDVRLADIGPAAQASLATETRTPFLFPASLCEREPRGAGVETRFSGREGWQPQVLDVRSPQPAACFKAKLLARDGSVLREAQALARRNPELTGSTLSLRSPVRTATKIPLVLSYCTDQPGGESLVSAPFLNYQRYILGVGSAPIDACFAVGLEDRFAADLGRAIESKVRAARAAAADRSDFVFAVVMHHRLAPIVSRFHQIVATTLQNKISEEQRLASPRLAGAFVYDSQAANARPIAPGPGVIWCPRLGGDGSAGAPSEGSLNGANCTPTSGGRVELGPFNFLVAMGPFPTMTAFLEYRARYGEEGRVGSPRLQMRAVHASEASQSDGSSSTFLDGQSVTAAPGESVRFCRERDSSYLLDSLAFRRQGAAAEPAMDVSQAQTLLARPAEAVVLNVGLRWSHPFFGALEYDSPIRGRVFGTIPIEDNVRSAQQFGDARWTRPRWDVGPLIQRCLRHCSHPYFDEAGVYQVQSAWIAGRSCPQPKYPEPAP